MVREVPAGLATSRRPAGWFSHSSERAKAAFANRPTARRAVIAICRPASGWVTVSTVVTVLTRI